MNFLSLRLTAYYNEIDPFCVEWLRKLMAKGRITKGDIDDRPIQEVQPEEVAGYHRVHFFAGIGGWERALSLAGWPDDWPVWTGSCPCQPFSSAGKGKGGADDRHLWPEWFRLIRQSRPPTLFGEQVASAIGHGWLDLVSADLEGEGYACGSAVLGAHSVGAPHIRKRLWFVAVSESERSVRRSEILGCEVAGSEKGHLHHAVGTGSVSGLVAFSESYRRGGWGDGCSESAGSRLESEIEAEGSSTPSRMGDAGLLGSAERQIQATGDIESGEVDSSSGLLGDGILPGLERHGKHGEIDGKNGREGEKRHDSPSGFWDRREWLPCRDGKARPVESLPVEMADGIPDGMGLVRYGDRAIFHPLVQETKNRARRLKGYGNAIVPQVGGAFIRAFMEWEEK